MYHTRGQNIFYLYLSPNNLPRISVSSEVQLVNIFESLNDTSVKFFQFRKKCAVFYLSTINIPNLAEANGAIVRATCSGLTDCGSLPHTEDETKTFLGTESFPVLEVWQT